MRHMGVWLGVLALVAFSGCVNVMNGTVDGEKVGPARTALFAEMDTGIPEMGVDGNMLMLVVTGLEPSVACDATKAEWEVDWEALDCQDACDDAVANALAYLSKPEYWQADLSLRPGGDGVATYDLGDVWDVLNDDPVFTGGLSHIITADAQDNDFCLESCANWQETFEDHDWWGTDGGSVDITAYEAGESLEGSYAVDFDGETVEGEFRAEFCDFVQ